MLDERKISVIFKAFCDENRIWILKLLATGEKCGCMLLEENQCVTAYFIASYEDTL